MKKCFPLLLLGLALCSSCQRGEVNVSTWKSPTGNVLLDYPEGDDAACDSIRQWLDGLKASFADADSLTLCQAQLAYQDPDYVTYSCDIRTLPTDFYEGDQSVYCYTVHRNNGHRVCLSDLTNDTAWLAQIIMRNTYQANDWIVPAMGGNDAFLAHVNDLAIGVNARGVTFYYPVMDGFCQELCTVPSGELNR